LKLRQAALRQTCRSAREATERFGGYGRAAHEAEKETKVSLSRAFIAAAAVLALCSQGRSGPAPAIHYAPAENLERLDAALIDQGKHEIDMAAYVLTDWPVMRSLTRAAERGVKVRVYLDGVQLAAREPAMLFRN
jgi:phosphatidylserine/phosphatidylglycerophosphate/cardiolipin synthase-like enzyme